MSTSSQMTRETVETKHLTTEGITLQGKHIPDIVTGTEPAGYPIDPLALISHGALELTLQEINRYIRALDPNGSNITDLALITLSICNPYFDRPEEWKTGKWIIYNNTCYCESNGSPLTLVSGKFPIVGKYLICITVDELPSGCLDIYLNDTWISTLSKPGVYYREFTVTDTTNDILKIVPNNIFSGDRVSIFSLSIHAIAERLYNFLVEKIKSMASLDATDFVQNEKFIHTLDEFTKQFQEATKQYLTRLAEHEDAVNPHNLTPKDIGAANKNHSHAEYLNKTQLQEIITDEMGHYAKIDHEHLKYLTIESAKRVITEIIQEHLSSLISVDALIVTKGNTGVIPSRLIQTDLSLPAKILIPTNINHTPDSSFDVRYGSISTNVEQLVNIAPHVFSLDMSKYGVIPKKNSDLPINFCLTYHTRREISGYRLRIRNAYLTEWSIYNDKTEFVHHLSVSEGDFKRISANEYIKEVYFEHVEESHIFSILIQDAEILDDNWELKVEILYEDFENEGTFGITKSGFQFCIPDKGTNRLINIHPRLNYLNISPEVKLPDTPVFIFGGKELNDEEASFTYSYIPPEYSSVRKGLPVLIDKYKNIDLDYAASPKELYHHPAFGDLILEEGHTAFGCKLTSLYSSKNEGWMSDGLTKKIVIVQTFSCKNLMLMGYTLNWRKNDEIHVPDLWTLTVEGYEKDGKRVTVVLDSVKQYYPFYSVEDTDVTYHKVFDREILIEKVTLTLETHKEDDPHISLNRLDLFVSERWYAISQNTMYLGMNPVSQMCLGSAHFKENVGWEPDNIPIGKSCVIPLNHLQMTEKNTEYWVHNPFMTTDVVVSIQNHNLFRESSLTPSAYVTNITPEKIFIKCETPYRYAVAISRNW